MKKFAITGNIGCGKSYICAAFERRGVPVFYSDDEAKKLYFLPEIKTAITAKFGAESYFPDGRLNTAFLSSILFSDKEALLFVEKLIYPALDARFDTWCSAQKSDFVLYESALIFEKNMESKFDKIIVVAASEEVRIRRTMLRDHATREEVMRRMALQLPQEEKVRRADFVISHDGDDDFEEQIEKILVN